MPSILLYLRRRPSVPLLAIFLAGFASISVPQSLRTGIDAVAVYVTVNASDGRLVTGLTKSDFQILDDGRPVAVTLFSDEQQPLSVAVMLDTSFSMARRENAVDAAALLSFVRALGSADRASLGTFGAQVAVGSSFTNEPRVFARILREEMWMGGGTPLWQAISEAVSSLREQRGRKVVVVYSDGIDTGSLPNWRGDASTVYDQAVRDNCMIYFIVPSARVGEPPPERARSLAEATGGGHFRFEDGMNLEAAFARLVQELRAQYLLGFVPAFDGKRHQIRVLINTPGLKARARKDYIAGGLR